MRPSPVHAKAEELGIPVRTPKSLRKPETLEEFEALQADIAVVAAYGLILSQEVLDAPAHGCVNIHASLLPRWRGAAPIHRAIMAGDAQTGVTIMQMEAGLDTGPMLHKVTTGIGNKTTGELTEELAHIGAQAVVDVIADLAAFPPEQQDDDATCYAPKIDKAEAQIDWNRPASELVRHIHGLAPFPGAWFELDGDRIKLLRAELVDGTGPAGEVLDERLMIACGDGALRPLRLQRAGKPAMDVEDFLRGRPVGRGTQLQ